MCFIGTLYEVDSNKNTFSIKQNNGEIIEINCVDVEEIFSEEEIGTINWTLLTREGRKAVRDGEITTEELGEMYKLQKVKEAWTIGTCTDSFNNSYKWIPDELKEELTPEQLGALTEAFYNCYGAGKNDKRGD